MATSKAKQARRKRRIENRKEHQLEIIANFNNPENLLGPLNMIVAGRATTRDVKWKPSIQSFILNMTYIAFESIDRLEALDGSRLSFYEFMISERGKRRRIQSVNPKERMEQHALVDNIIEPMLTHTFIYDNAASIAGKGIHFSINRTKTHLLRFFHYYGSNHGYALLLDLHAYFASIDHVILKEKLSKFLMNDAIDNKTQTVIDSFDKGLGLGSQLSQILALFFLNKLDHYIKEVICCRYYSRYMDDSCLLFETLEEAEKARDIIIHKYNEIEIELNPNKVKIYNLSKQPFPFLQKEFKLTETGKVVIHDISDGEQRMRGKIHFMREMYDANEISIEYIYNLFTSWVCAKKEFMDPRRLKTFQKDIYIAFPELKHINQYKEPEIDYINDTRLPGEIFTNRYTTGLTCIR